MPTTSTTSTLCSQWPPVHGAVQGQRAHACAAWPQGMMLLLTGPFIDKLVSRQWITSYILTFPALQCLALSCAIAVLVNISQFMCLGRFSAMTFQVLARALRTSWAKRKGEAASAALLASSSSSLALLPSRRSLATPRPSWCCCSDGCTSRTA